VAQVNRAVVLGAGGLLGRHLVDELVMRGILCVSYPRASCPIDDLERVRVAVSGASHVFNAAAWTDVDGAEVNAELAFRANAYGAENVARAAAEVGATVVHVSTDFVFAGDLEGRGYDEFDATAPKSVYARSKRAGEILVEKLNPRHHVVRVQGLYGFGGKSFSSRLRSLLMNHAPNIRLDNERRVQPTSAVEAAAALCNIAASDRFGYWHASCRGSTTWHRFALHMARRLNLVPDWSAVSTASLALAAHRPFNCVLQHRRLEMCDLPLLPPWEEALDDYLATEEKRA
jgi:dTDP-4-dehydrorhamnose reductase